MSYNIQQSLAAPYKAVINVSAASMSTPKRDATNGVLTAEVGCVSLVDPNTGLVIGVTGSPLVTSGGGGGGGSGFADLLYIDSTGQQFFWQDNGTSLSAYKVQSGAYVAYTPVAPWTPFGTTGDQNASGTIATNGGAVSLSINGVSSVYAIITGTWVGSIQFRGLSPDGATWIPLNAVSGGPLNAYSTTAFTANAGVRIMLPAGFKAVEAYASAWTSGTATININASSGVSNVEAIQLNPANFNATVAQSNAANLNATVVQSNPANFNATVTLGPTNFTFSAYNAVYTGLTSGSSTPTTAGWENVLTGASISVLVTNTVACAFTVYASIDSAGVYQLPPVTYQVPAGAGLEVSFPANGNYYQYVLTNNSGSTGNFNVNVAYGTIGASGQAPTSLSQSVALASDQPAIAVNADAPNITVLPSSISMAALNAAVAWTVEGGSGYLLSVSPSPGATAAFSGTLSFQYSINGGLTWSALSATPVAAPTAQNVTTSTTVGLWQVIAPQVPLGQVCQIRVLMSAYTSGTVYADILSLGQAGAAILLPWTYSVTSGATLAGPFNTAGVDEYAIQVSAVTTTVLTVQGTNDPSLTTWDTVPVTLADATTTVATTITTAGTYRWSAAGYKYMRVQVTTTGTVLTVQGLSARLGTPSSPLVSIANANLPQNLTQIGGAAVSSTTAQLGINVVNVGGTAAAASIANGSTNKGLGTTQMTAVSQTDVNAGAFAGAGRVNGTVIASAQGGGAVVSAEINVSTLTLGTATSVFFTLQESNGGTNFTDIWVSDPITATGIVRVPAIPVAGRRRWSAFSVGGTSTTVTATITALELPAGSYPLMRQMRDAYAATNPFATQINSVATASTFVLGTLSSSTTIFNIEGTKAFTAFMTLAGSPTVTTQPVVSVQGSMDGTNWVTITGATMTAAGNGTYATSVANTPYKYCKLTVTTAAAYSAGSYTISNIGVQAVN